MPTIPIPEDAYDAACKALAEHVDILDSIEITDGGYNGYLSGLTAYQAAIRTVEAAAPILLAEAEKRLARMTQAARAASMYLPEPERANFRREYGFAEVTI